MWLLCRSVLQNLCPENFHRIPRKIFVTNFFTNVLQAKDCNLTKSNSSKVQYSLEQLFCKVFENNVSEFSKKEGNYLHITFDN